MGQLLCRINGLAASLNLPSGWLLEEADAGRIPSMRIGRHLLFNLDAVRECLANRAANAGEECQSVQDGGGTFVGDVPANQGISTSETGK